MPVCRLAASRFNTYLFAGLPVRQILFAGLPVFPVACAEMHVKQLWSVMLTEALHAC